MDGAGVGDRVVVGSEGEASIVKDMDESKERSTSRGKSVSVRVGEGAGEREGWRELPYEGIMGDEEKQSILRMYRGAGRTRGVGVGRVSSGAALSVGDGVVKRKKVEEERGMACE